MSFNGSLALWLHKRAGLLSLQEVAGVVRKVADALQQMHNQQKIHQDVNPSNVLIHVYGENAEHVDLQLADRSRIVHTSTNLDKSFSVNSLIMYMAPEQWLGRAVPATDQYALAVMAYELLTGLPPFQGPPAQVMDLHINAQPPAPGTLNQRVSPAIDAVILSALAKRPEDRFSSVSAFAIALEQAIQRPESLFVNVSGGTPVDSSLRATLLISRAESINGTLRTITLPRGQRITVPVPKGAYDGQIIRLEGFGDPVPTPTGKPAGALLLSILVSQTGESIPAGGLAKQKKSRATSASYPSRISRVTTGRIYSAVSNASPRRKAVFLVSLVLIVILGGIGLFSFIRTSSVPIPYPPHSGSLAIDDALRDNTGDYNWPDGISSDGGTCQFMQGTYHIVMTQAGSFHYCVAGATGFSDFAYEVRMTIINGDEGGIIFRADGPNGKFYYFRVGRDGSYDLYLYVDAAGAHAQRLATGITPAVHTGLRHPNLLAVVARHGTLDLYVNNQPVTSVSNNTYSYGQIGVAAAYDTDLTEVTFSNVKVWTL